MSSLIKFTDSTNGPLLMIDVPECKLVLSEDDLLELATMENVEPKSVTDALLIQPPKHHLPTDLQWLESYLTLSTDQVDTAERNNRKQPIFVFVGHEMRVE